MVHDIWLTMFNQYCFSVNIKGGGARLKDGGAPCYHPLGETLITSNNCISFIAFVYLMLAFVTY